MRSPRYWSLPWTLPASMTNRDFCGLNPANPGLLRLASGSDLVDAGAKAGLLFNGAAPDLGAFEEG